MSEADGSDPDEPLVGLGCGYQGHEFGSRAYPDSVCIDGYLWDADSCEEPGGLLFFGGDIPCPKCNATEHADYFSG